MIWVAVAVVVAVISFVWVRAVRRRRAAAKAATQPPAQEV
jgi:heme exporter protein D